MKFIDFFAGIGGFRRGLELAGHKCIGFCEWDKYAVASYTSMHLITDEQQDYLATMPLQKRQKEILKDEYKNGEWFAGDICGVDARNLPRADCWCFGSPCQNFSLAGLREGLRGDKSSLIREIFRLLEEQQEEDRPEWLIYENVAGMFSSNGGLDYLSILSELDRLGFDCEWQNINSAQFVPQNRQRIYTIGHNRRYGAAKVFPIEGTDGQNSVSLIGHRKGYHRNTETFGLDGITEALSTCQGGGREHHVALPCFIDMTARGGINPTEKARAIQARYTKGISEHSRELSGVALGVIDPQGRLSKDCEISDTCPTLRAQSHGNEPEVMLGVDNCKNPPSDREGIYVKINDNLTVYAVWYEKEQCYITIRKLTPRECFRLQGWEDEYFDRAQFVNSDSQLYKQAGNGVTVPVVEAIGRKLKEYEEGSEDLSTK